MKFKIFESKRLDFHSFIESFTKVVEAKDLYTAGHSERVSDLAVEIAGILKLDTLAIEELHIAGHLHDIGKVGIPDGILLKAGKLNKQEYELIKNHSIIGWEILSNIRGFENIASYVKSHHERADGKGYPDGITGDNIPIGAAILAVADAYDAMTSSRTYRRAMSENEALNEIMKNSGTQFIPAICSAFFESRKHKNK